MIGFLIKLRNDCIRINGVKKVSVQIDPTKSRCKTTQHNVFYTIFLCFILYADIEKTASNHGYLKSGQKEPPELFYKKDVLKNYAKFTGKHLCQSLFFNKVAYLRPATLLKKRL